MITPAPPEDNIPPDAVRVGALLKRLGVTHVVTVPDNTSAPLLEALEASGRGSGGEEAADPGIQLLYATREGEALGLASGLWMGGAVPAVLIQNTGLMEAGDGLRGTAARMGVPLLMLVTCRGYAKARSLGLDPDSVDLDRDTLVRNDLDSVAHMTEKTLRAWGIPFIYLTDPGDLGPLENAWSMAQDEERPVALLVDTSFEQNRPTGA